MIATRGDRKREPEGKRLREHETKRVASTNDGGIAPETQATRLEREHDQTIAHTCISVHPNGSPLSKGKMPPAHSFSNLNTAVLLLEP